MHHMLDLTKEKQALHDCVKCLTTDTQQAPLHNKSMRDNLVTNGIPEHAGEALEVTMKSFIKEQLELLVESINHITFYPFMPNQII